MTSPREFKQRPAGVAGIDGRIGLDSVFDGRAVSVADGANRADDALRHRSAQAEGIADGIHLFAHSNLARVGQNYRLQFRRVDLEQREVMHLVAADHGCLVAALVAQLHLDAAIGAFYHVVIGEHMAGFVENESRTLAFLRHRPVEEVEDDSARRDVDDRGQHAMVDGDVVLLFRVKCWRSLCLRQLQRRAGGSRARECQRIQASLEMGGDKPESTNQKNDQNKLAQFHSSLRPCDLSI